MRYLIFLTSGLLIAYGIGYIFSAQMHNHNVPGEFMDRQHTDCLRGFSILTVLWAHFGAHFGVEGIQFVAGVGVSVFLVCSGYGLMMSYQKKGLKDFWKKRLPRILVAYWVVESIRLIFQDSVSVEAVWNVVILKEANWYIGYILVCYCIFWCVCRFLQTMQLGVQYFFKGTIICFAIWFLLDSCVWAEESMPFLRARQMFAFPLGIWLASSKERFIQQCERSKIKLIIGGMVVLGMLGQLVTQLAVIKALPYVFSNTIYLMVNVLLTVAMLLIDYIYKLLMRNVVLSKIGLISYELFLLNWYFINHMSDYQSIAMWSGMLLLTAWMLHWACEWLNRHIIRND